MDTSNTGLIALKQYVFETGECIVNSINELSRRPRSLKQNNAPTVTRKKNEGVKNRKQQSNAFAEHPRPRYNLSRLAGIRATGFQVMPETVVYLPMLLHSGIGGQRVLKGHLLTVAGAAHVGFESFVFPV